MRAGAHRNRAAWAAGLAFVWACWRWATGFDGLYGQDAHEYLRYATALREWLLTGADPGFSRWPPGYPMAAALLSLVGIPVMAAPQLVSFLSWLAAFWFGSIALDRLFPSPRGTAYWALLFSLSPFLMRIAFSSMSDMLAIALGCAFVSLGLGWLENRRALELGAAFACFSGAVATRFSAPVVLGLFAAWLFFEALKARDRAAAGAAILGAIGPWALTWWAWSLETLALSNAEEWSFWNMASRSFSTASAGEHSYVLPNLLSSFVPLIHPGFCLFGILLVASLRRSDFQSAAARVLALNWVVFALFLAGLALQNHRHHLASFPIAMTLLFPAFDRAMTRLGSLVKPAARLRFVAALVVGAQFVLLGFASRALLAAQRQELRIAERLRLEPPVTLYSFSFSLALRNRGVTQRVVELWDTEPKEARAGDLVLFAPERLAAQWSTEPLMRNFEMLRPRLRSGPIADFGGGWFLYRVEHGAPSTP